MHGQKNIKLPGSTSLKTSIWPKSR